MRIMASLALAATILTLAPQLDAQELGPVAPVTKRPAGIDGSTGGFKGTAESAVDSTGGPYMLPGITAFKKGQWVGSDNLYNITNNIGVSVEIIKPLGRPIPIDSNTIRNRIAGMFDRAGIIPIAEGKGVKAPLPFFHILIMIYPVEKGYVASINGRLFEPVALARINLDKNITWQAITWEKQDLIIASADLLNEQLFKSIDEITNNFIERFKFFENIKSQSKLLE